MKPEVRGYTDKNKRKFSSYIRKFRGIGCKVIYSMTNELVDTYI